MKDRVNILGVGFDNINMKEALKYGLGLFQDKPSRLLHAESGNCYGGI